MLKVLLRSLWIILAITGAAIAVSFLGGCTRVETKSSNSVVRLHIEANSNSEKCQAAKYLVRDVLLVFLHDNLENSSSVNETLSIITKRRARIERLANLSLAESGLFYSAAVGIENRYFPKTRYQNLTLKSGYYNSLVVVLGTGSGQNWFCVLFPSICYGQFFDSTSIQYRSFLLDLINRLR